MYSLSLVGGDSVSAVVFSLFSAVMRSCCSSVFALSLFDRLIEVSPSSVSLLSSSSVLFSSLSSTCSSSGLTGSSGLSSVAVSNGLDSSWFTSSFNRDRSFSKSLFSSDGDEVFALSSSSSFLISTRLYKYE